MNEFVDRFCDVGPGCMETVKALWDAWNVWCAFTGEEPGLRKHFAEYLDDSGFKEPSVKTAQAVRTGIRLKHNAYNLMGNSYV